VLAQIKEDMGDFFTQQLTPHSNVVLSKKVDANEIIVNDCHYATGVTRADKPFWRANLAETVNVRQVKVYNTLNGADSSNLGSATVYVGGKFCGKMPKSPKLDTIVSVECEGPGVRGNTIEIKGVSPGTMMVCDA
jgi:hypothetical protein